MTSASCSAPQPVQSLLPYSIDLPSLEDIPRQLSLHLDQGCGSSGGADQRDSATLRRESAGSKQRRSPTVAAHSTETKTSASAEKASPRGRPPPLNFGSINSNDARPEASKSPTRPVSSPAANVPLPFPSPLREAASQALLRVADMALNPRDIGARFLQKYGNKVYDWSGSVSFNSAPFTSSGLSEASMYHCVLEIVSSSKGGGSGSPSSLEGSPRRRSPTFLSASASTLRGLFYSVGGGKILGRSRSKSASPYDTFDSLNASSDVVDYTSSSLQQQQVADEDKPRPPPTFVMKHYDTSVVDTPSMLVRIARHLTSTTAEKMAEHELFFYSRLAHFYWGSSCPFRVPKVLFCAALDRGNPGFFKYVCCGSGSGSSVTIGMEDLVRSGFSFQHIQNDGLYDDDLIYSVLVGMAYLHSTMWGRINEEQNLKKKVEPAAIYRFVHRGQPVLHKPTSKSDVRSYSIDAESKKWRNYKGAYYSKFQSWKLAMKHIQSQWELIRQKATEIVMREETFLLGDMHYKNIGFRINLRHVQRKMLQHVESRTHMIRGIIASSCGNGEQSPTGYASPVTQQPPSAFPPPSPSKLFTRRREAGSTEHVTDAEAHVVKPSPHSGVMATLPSSSQNHQGQPSGNLAADPQTPRSTANDGGTVPGVQPCFFDFQSCGPGSAAAELLYFLCTSVPVSVDLSSHGALIDVSDLSKQPVPSTRPPAAAAGSQSMVPQSSSFAALSLPTQRSNSPDNDSFSVPPLPTDVTPPPSSGGGDSTGGKVEGPTLTNNSKLTLPELITFDVLLITNYYKNLHANIRAQYPLHKLIYDVYVLARHWGGCLFLDMATSSPEERNSLKKIPQFARLLQWSEKTMERVFAMCIAVFAEVDMLEYMTEEIAAAEERASLGGGDDGAVNRQEQGPSSAGMMANE